MTWVLTVMWVIGIGALAYAIVGPEDQPLMRSMCMMAGFFVLAVTIVLSVMR